MNNVSLCTSKRGPFHDYNLFLADLNLVDVLLK